MSADARLSDVEISAALLTEGDQECIGFTIHQLAPVRVASGSSLEQLCVAIEQLTQRMGAAKLPELLGEASKPLSR